jgi:ABC-type dipeptide/oligopeptide/nickel transport system permease subunit
MSLNSEVSSEATIAGRSPRQIAWSRFKRNKVGMAAAGVSVLLLSMSLFAPVVCRIIGINPKDLNLEGLDSSGVPRGAAAGYSWEHPLGLVPGTGRDLLAQLLYGSRISFMVAILTTATALTIGFFVGIAGGYFRGRVDGYLGRFTDFLLAFPAFFMIVALSEPMVGRIQQLGIAEGNSARIVFLIIFLSYVNVNS